MRCRAVVAAIGALIVLAGCGSSTSGHQARAVTLMLDFTPNAVHAGIYASLAHRYDRQQGIALKVLPPPSPVDAIKLLEDGRVDFSLIDIHDLALARARGAQIEAIMAIVEQPLAAVLAQPQISSPRQLQGRTVGVPGVPSDYAVLDSVVAGAGGAPRRVHTIVIGSNAVGDLLAGRVAAATGFWNDEGVALGLRRPGFHVFRVDAFGAPRYPELLLCARRSTLEREPGLARALVAALTRGYALTVARPAVAAADLERSVAGLDPRLVRADLAALGPAFLGADGRPGTFDLQTLRSWASWEARFHLVARPPDIAQMFDTRFVH